MIWNERMSEAGVLRLWQDGSAYLKTHADEETPCKNSDLK
jgi:hypothetical protein